MPSHLYPSNSPWTDPDSISASATFTLNVPVINYGDEVSDENDRIIVDLAQDYSNERKEYYTTAPGLHPQGEQAIEIHIPGDELSAGQWQVSAKRENDSGYSDFHLTFTIDEE